MIALLLVASLFAADSTQAYYTRAQVYYAEENERGLKRLLAQADTRAEALLCRYRLYPLTEDEDLLEDLPTDLAHGSVRELALLAGLWGYRAARAPFWKKPAYGRRAQHFLDRARTKDPLAPYVLLIGGQFLLFKPALFGGDDRRALLRFRQLRTVLARRSHRRLLRQEAALWIWYALNELGHTQKAAALRTQLLAQSPPELYQAFLGKKG